MNNFQQNDKMRTPLEVISFIDNELSPMAVRVGESFRAKHPEDEVKKFLLGVMAGMDISLSVIKTFCLGKDIKSMLEQKIKDLFN